MSRLEEQLDELEVLEAMFSSPGEFEIDDTFSYEQAKAFVNKSSADPPPGALSCKLRISVTEASQDSDAEDEEQDSRAPEAAPTASHNVEISLRLPNRLFPGSVFKTA